MAIVIEKKMKGNILEQIRRKISECQEKKNIVIEFEKGEYLLSDKKAVEDFEKLMRGDLDYDTHWGKDDIGYNKGLSFEGIDGVTIKGNGSILIFEGLISPLTFIDCSQIKIQDLCIDWKRPPFSIGKITKVEKETVTIKGHSDFPIYGGEPIWALMDYNPYKQRFGQVWKFRNMSTIRKISENIYEFDTSVSEKLIEGYMIVLRHVGNYRPCMHFLKSQDIYIENVTLFNNPGMGIVGHYSKNFTFRRLSVKPKKDHIMSTTTDATHFISCEGVLDFEECYFEGMGDDAINVHGFYNYITKIISENQVEVTILNENGTQDQVFDIPGQGDEVEFSKELDLAPFAKNNTVKESKFDPKNWSGIITFENPVHEDIQVGDLLTKTSNVAALRFVKCHIKSIRARACLIQTRNVVIENCFIENCTGTGIHVDTATGWWESTRCDNVSIRHNRIKECGYGDGTYLDTSGIVVMTECEKQAVGIHKNIVIEHNIIYGNGNKANKGISVQCSDGVKIGHNQIKGCDVAIDIKSCDHVELYENITYNQKIQFDRNG